MHTFERTIILCKINDLTNQNGNSFCYIPELVSIQTAAKILLKKEINAELSEKLAKLKRFQSQFGAGILPLKLSAAKIFIEDLYNEILKNHLPLPANTSQNDLEYQVKNLPKFKKHILIEEHKIIIQRKNLTFFAKYLPLVGLIVTLTLTAGLTFSALATSFDWGWSIFLLSFFGVCKSLANYVDIAGGPERRLQILGFWIDRFINGYDTRHGKFSLSQFLLNSFVITIVASSSLLTWYGAWQTVRCKAVMSYLPEIMASSFAGIFAWFSAGSSFGRTYSELYQLLYKRLSSYVSFDHIKENAKLDLQSLSEKLQLRNMPCQNQDIASYPNPILHQYQLESSILPSDDGCLDTGSLSLTQRANTI